MKRSRNKGTAMFMTTDYLLSLTLICCLVISSSCSLSCDKLDSCRCEMSDGSGQINLRGLALAEVEDSYFTIPGGDGWIYKYNPCYEFSWGFSTSLAVAQTTKNANSVHDLGTQNSTYYNITSGGEVSIHYTSLDRVRSSRVILACTAGVNTHSLQFIGELVITEYDFILESPCACPGLCNDNGIISPVAEPEPTSDTANINVNVNNPNNGNSNSVMWTDVGGAMVALIFHDVFLVAMIVCVLMLMRSMGYCTGSQLRKPGFGPGDVTDAASRPTTSKKLNGDASSFVDSTV